jgi:sugar phosphate isomerase/epimerase
VTEPDLVASYITLAGSGFTEPPRYTFRERCEAASDAGFTGIGIHVTDLAVLTPLDVEQILADTGLALREIEFLAGWINPNDGANAQATMERVTALAERVGGDHLSAGDFSGAPLDMKAAAQRLIQLASAAHGVGLRIALEAFAWSAVNTIEKADALLRQVDTPAVGHLLDVWHFFNTGADFTMLQRLPAHRIAAVQLNDGPRVYNDFLWNARNTRFLPGDGELDVCGLLDTLNGIGYTGPYCVEVNYPEFRAYSVADAAKRAYDATATYF